jgi:glutamate decarboxylase
MPDNATDIAVLRIVVREGLTRDLADDLVKDIAEAVGFLREHPTEEPTQPAFSHN